MMKKIKLYGPLRKLCKVNEFEADVSNVDQIFSFIKVNYPNTKQHLTESFYSVQIDNLDITFLNFPIKSEAHIKVIPLISGNFFFTFFSTLFLSSSIFVKGATFFQALKVALAVTALEIFADLLAVTPPTQGSDPQVESFLSNQTANTTKSGGAAPLVFGECLVGSVVISAGADTVQVADSTP